MPSLTLAQANKIVETALAKAREMKIKPLAVAVLDQSGHVKSLQREDGAVVRDPAQVASGERLRARVAEGELAVTVDQG